jgi:hypothetical protein
MLRLFELCALIYCSYGDYNKINWIGKKYSMYEGAMMFSVF